MLRAFSIPAPRLFSFLFPLRNRQRFALFRFLRLGFFFSFSFTESSALRASSIPACIRTLETFVSSCSCRGVPSSPIPFFKPVCNGDRDLWHCKAKKPRLQLQTGTNVRGTTLIPEISFGLSLCLTQSHGFSYSP